MDGHAAAFPDSLRASGTATRARYPSCSGTDMDAEFVSEAERGLSELESADLSRSERGRSEFEGDTGASSRVEEADFGLSCRADRHGPW